MATTRVSDGLYRPDLTHLATVYGPDAAGRFTVVLQANLPCALLRQGLSRAGDDPSSVRADLTNQRQFHWDPSYVMPEHDGAEVAIDGERWHPISGSFDAMEGPTGEIFYRLCDVKRV